MTEIQGAFSAPVGESATTPLPGAPRSIRPSSDEPFEGAIDPHLWPADALERVLKAIDELPTAWLPGEVER